MHGVRSSEEGCVLRIRLACVLVALPLILAGCHQKAPQPSSSNLEHSSISSIRRVTEGDNTYPVVENTRFYADPRYWIQKDKSVDLVVQETVETQFNPNAECCVSKLRATGFINQTQRWIIEQPAHEGSLEGRFYKTTIRGCCAATTRYQYYDPLTGHKVYSATQDVIQMGEAGFDPDSTYFVIDQLSEMGDNINVLKLQYGTQAGAIETKYLVTGNGTIYANIAVTALDGGKRTALIRADRKDSSTVFYWDGGVPRYWDGAPISMRLKKPHRNFLELDLEAGGKALIPVAQGGKLDLNGMTLPPGASLKAAPPAGYKDLY